MTDGYLSKDRDHLNRMQRERRARLVRIDYQPDADVLALIEAKRPPFGVQSTNSAVLNAIVREWAEATGAKCRKVERPETSGAPGISQLLQPTRAIKSGRELRKWERVPCGGKRRRDGQPCQALSVPGKRRCKWHGGASTGPKTPEGKAKALANLKRGTERGGGDQGPS